MEIKPLNLNPYQVAGAGDAKQSGRDNARDKDGRRKKNAAGATPAFSATEIDDKPIVTDVESLGQIIDSEKAIELMAHAPIVKRLPDSFKKKPPAKASSPSSRRINKAF